MQLLSDRETYNVHVPTYLCICLYKYRYLYFSMHTCTYVCLTVHNSNTPQASDRLNLFCRLLGLTKLPTTALKPRSSGTECSSSYWSDLHDRDLIIQLTHNTILRTNGQIPRTYC